MKVRSSKWEGRNRTPISKLRIISCVLPFCRAPHAALDRLALVRHTLLQATTKQRTTKQIVNHHSCAEEKSDKWYQAK